MSFFATECRIDKKTGFNEKYLKEKKGKKERKRQKEERNPLTDRTSREKNGTKCRHDFAKTGNKDQLPCQNYKALKSLERWLKLCNDGM